MIKTVGASTLGTPSGGTIRYLNEIRNPEWHEDALCKGRDLELYVLKDGDKSQEEIARYRKTAEECLDCLVFVKCRSEARPSDLEYTIRGGELPLQLRSRGRGRPRLDALMRQVSAGICNAGLHTINGDDDLNKAYECKICSATRRSLSAQLKTHCINGHEMTESNCGWKPKPTGGERRYCRTCSRFSENKRKAKKKGEGKAAKIVA